MHDLMIGPGDPKMGLVHFKRDIKRERLHAYDSYRNIALLSKINLERLPNDVSIMNIWSKYFFI
jgi:hypothetical protein